jgi:hypothetical protein
MPRIITGVVLVAALVFVLASIVQQSHAAVGEEATNEGESSLSLMTADAEEGFALAVALSRRSVTEMQPDKEVLHAGRPVYARDPEGLIAASHVVAVHFQTVAAANNYWRD